MKVKELIKMLQEYDQELNIAMYVGDYELLDFEFRIDDVYTNEVIDGYTRQFDYMENGSYRTHVLGIFQ